MRDPRERYRRHIEKQRDLGLNPVSPTEQPLDGRKATVGLLRKMSDEARRHLLDAVDDTDAELSAQLKHEVYMFGDLVQLDEHDMGRLTQRVFETDRELFALALRSCTPRLKIRMLLSLGSIARDQINYKLETMGRRRLSHVEDAQHRIVEIAKELARERLIVLFPSNPDDPFV